MIGRFNCSFAVVLAAAVGLALMPATSMAQTSSSATASSSSGVLCKDGTASARSGRGACRGHGGVDKSKSPRSSKSRRPRAAASAPSSGAPATAAAADGSQSVAASTLRSHRSPEGASTVAAPGGGNGQVWVNSGSKVYHCPGTRWYGKTKHGEYMPEAQARSQGDRPDHGKSCS
jgi:hypothetical protein